MFPQNIGAISFNSSGVALVSPHRERRALQIESAGGRPGGALRAGAERPELARAVPPKTEPEGLSYDGRFPPIRFQKSLRRANIGGLTLFWRYSRILLKPQAGLRSSQESRQKNKSNPCFQGAKGFADGGTIWSKGSLDQMSAWPLVRTGIVRARILV